MRSGRSGTSYVMTLVAGAFKFCCAGDSSGGAGSVLLSGPSLGLRLSDRPLPARCLPGRFAGTVRPADFQSGSSSSHFCQVDGTRFLAAEILIYAPEGGSSRCGAFPVPASALPERGYRPDDLAVSQLSGRSARDRRHADQAQRGHHHLCRAWAVAQPDDHPCGSRRANQRTCAGHGRGSFDSHGSDELHEGCRAPEQPTRHPRVGRPNRLPQPLIGLPVPGPAPNIKPARPLPLPAHLEAVV
jgi:hypothetical protein